MRFIRETSSFHALRERQDVCKRGSCDALYPGIQAGRKPNKRYNVIRKDRGQPNAIFRGVKRTCLVSFIFVRLQTPRHTSFIQTMTVTATLSPRNEGIYLNVPFIIFYSART